MSSASKNVSVWAVVAAAGVGRRMPGPTPKQYRVLAQRSVLDHTLARLLDSRAIGQVMVALSPDDAYWVDSEFSQHPRVLTCHGGSQRADSVLAALDALAALRDGPKDASGVLVHDAARALLPAEALQRLLAEPIEEHGALLGWPSQDTLKLSEDGQRVARSIDRATVWQAQTPQYFQFAVLRRALRAALQSGVAITDESSCMELAGYQPRLVLGDANNFKITTPADFALAQALMEQA
ncbi:MAG: 2-C-methyl-D-erythritol 4-phosphate cytidylyltransferase [Oceanococcus sp.]